MNVDESRSVDNNVVDNVSEHVVTNSEVVTSGVDVPFSIEAPPPDADDADVTVFENGVIKGSTLCFRLARLIHDVTEECSLSEREKRTSNDGLIHHMLVKTY